MNKKVAFFTIIGLIFIGVFVVLYTCQKRTTNPQTIERNHGIIDAKGLKTLLDSNANVVVLDARTDEWFIKHPMVIKGAKRLPLNARPEKIAQTLPSKDTLIIVYCYSAGCPAAQLLAENLRRNGYSHIIEYANGLKEWAYTLGSEKGYLTQKTIQ